MSNFLKGFDKGLGENPGLSMSGLGEALGSNISGIATGAGNIVGGIISNGMETDAGNILNAVGDIGGMIPGPWGAAIGAGAKVLGGVANAAFGMKTNQEALNAANQGTNYLNNFVSSASSLEDVQGPLALANVQNAYKGGWFKKGKAARKNAELRKARSLAEGYANRSVYNNVNNIAQTQMDTLASNYAALGGLLNFGGANSYALLNEALYNDRLKNLTKSKLSSMPNSFIENNTYSTGGLLDLVSIVEKGANNTQGVFNMFSDLFSLNKKSDHNWASKLTQLGNNSNSYGTTAGLTSSFWGALGSLANMFDKGGNLHTNGSIFSNGVSIIGNGGTHEENPLDGVPIGVDAQGVPNLVEEGEVIFNDYVFSNRLNVPKAIRKKYKLRGNKDLTFADAAKKIQKESEERPNDPISQRGLEDAMLELSLEQEMLKMKKYNKKKKTIEDKNLFAGGGPAGMQPLDDEENPWITSTGSKVNNPFATDGTSGTILPEVVIEEDAVDSTPQTREELEQDLYKYIKGKDTSLRYAPAIGLGIASLMDTLGLTNNPQYENAKAIENMGYIASQINPVRATPLGDYLTYKPLDRNYYTNRLMASAAANRRGILNTSGRNRAQAMAGLLASDYNANLQLGDLIRKAEEYNLAQRQTVKDFNRATNNSNAERFLKAATTNQASQLKANNLLLESQIYAANMREKARQRVEDVKSSNMSNFLSALGAIGKDNMAQNQAAFKALTNGVTYPKGLLSLLGYNVDQED